MRLTRLSLVLFTVMTGTTVNANEVHCEPNTVDNDAYAVVGPSDYVNAFSDPNGKVCAFSVNGASRNGSRTAADWSRVIDELGRSDVAGIAAELTVARADRLPQTVAGYREQVGPRLLAASEGLVRCFQALRSFGTVEQPEPMFVEAGQQYYLNQADGETQLSCWVTSAGTYRSYRSDGPALFLFVGTKGGRDSLFVPRGAFGG